MEMLYIPVGGCARYTFEVPKIKKQVEKTCKGKTLNLFAGQIGLKADETRVDMDKNMPADYHMTAEEFLKMAISKGLKYDTVVLDPPYNVRKSREKYNGRYIGCFTKLKDSIAKIVANNGIVMTFGYNTAGLTQSRGFKKIAIWVIYHAGDYNDTLCVVEQKVNNGELTNESISSL
jgi:16S rRNA G966 N2-methylase RsmD